MTANFKLVSDNAAGIQILPYYCVTQAGMPGHAGSQATSSLAVTRKVRPGPGLCITIGVSGPSAGESQAGLGPELSPLSQ